MRRGPINSPQKSGPPPIGKEFAAPASGPWLSNADGANHVVQSVYKCFFRRDGDGNLDVVNREGLETRAYPVHTTR